MKTAELNYMGIPIKETDLVKDGFIYLVGDNFEFKYPLRKDGQPDMRYGINKLHFKVLKMSKVFSKNRPTLQVKPEI